MKSRSEKPGDWASIELLDTAREHQVQENERIPIEPLAAPVVETIQTVMADRNRIMNVQLPPTGGRPSARLGPQKAPIVFPGQPDIHDLADLAQ